MHKTKQYKSRIDWLLPFPFFCYFYPKPLIMKTYLFTFLITSLLVAQDPQVQYLLDAMSPEKQFVNATLKQVNDNAPINMGVMQIISAAEANDKLTITYQLTAPNPQLTQTPKKELKTQTLQMMKATKQHGPYLDYGLTLINRYLDEAGNPLVELEMTPADFMAHMTPEEIEIQRLNVEIKQLKALLTEEQKAALEKN